MLKNKGGRNPEDLKAEAPHTLDKGWEMEAAVTPWGGSVTGICVPCDVMHFELKGLRTPCSKRKA